MSPFTFANTRTARFMEPAGGFHVISRGCNAGTRVALLLFDAAAEIVRVAVSSQRRVGVAFSTVKRNVDTLRHVRQNPNEAS